MPENYVGQERAERDRAYDIDSAYSPGPDIPDRDDPDHPDNDPADSEPDDWWDEDRYGPIP